MPGRLAFIPGNPVRMASNRLNLHLLASACSVHRAACVNLIRSSSLAKGPRACRPFADSLIDDAPQAAAKAVAGKLFVGAQRERQAA